MQVSKPNSPVNVVNVNRWIADNQTDFVPPVCNKLMHNDQLTIMFVGGPNVRKDYHLEEGEELFYQVKGDICVKVIERNQHRDVIIREGEIFLLPARIPHSPNRFAGTVGFVMERKREDNEIDCLRYYQDQCTDRLFERWFHTMDLGQQLGPVIKEFFASEEYRSGQPKADSFPAKPLIDNNEKIDLGNPFPLNNWIDEHHDELSKGHALSLFAEKFQTRVNVLSQGEHAVDCAAGDVWLWQHRGRSQAHITPVDKETAAVTLETSDSVYLHTHWKCQLTVDNDGIVLAISQDPRRKMI